MKEGNEEIKNVINLIEKNEWQKNIIGKSNGKYLVRTESLTNLKLVHHFATTITIHDNVFHVDCSNQTITHISEFPLS